MADAFRWAILGAGKFGREQMGPAIHAADDSVLAAVATSDAAKAEGFRRFAPDLRVVTDYDQMLADPGIDGVYLPLPNHLHVDWTKRALAAGKHVLCEKPIAMRAQEIDDLIAARDAAGKLAAEAYMIVHHPQWQRARDLVAEGAIGRLIHVDGVFSYDNRTDPDNIRNRIETGGGGLRDIGVYTFGSARFVTGEEPVEVTGNIRWENGVDTFAHVTAGFPSFTYNAIVSMRMFPRQQMVFHGDKGVLTVSTPFNTNVFGQAELHLETAGLTVRTERFPGANHYKLQVENFIRSARDGAEYPCPLEFSRGTQRMIDMVFDAANKPA